MKKRFLAILTAAMLLMTGAALGEAAPAEISGDFTGTAQGFGGEVTVTVTLTDGAITAVTAEGAGETRVLGVRAQGNVILLRLDGITDMDAARAQVGRVYYLAKADARLPKGRYFIDDLLDCEVADADTGRVYGRLTNVEHPAAQDIYTVTDAAGEEHMLPAVPEFVKTIDMENRRILITPIEGMFTDAVNGDEG